MTGLAGKLLVLGREAWSRGLHEHWSGWLTALGHPSPPVSPEDSSPPRRGVPALSEGTTAGELFGNLTKREHSQGNVLSRGPLQGGFGQPPLPPQGGPCLACGQGRKPSTGSGVRRAPCAPSAASSVHQWPGWCQAACLSARHGDWLEGLGFSDACGPRFPLRTTHELSPLQMATGCDVSGLFAEHRAPVKYKGPLPCSSPAMESITGNHRPPPPSSAS